MSVFHAYFSSIGSFFSIWVFCLLQIIPFFLTFIVGAGLTAGNAGDLHRIYEALFLSLAAFAGFVFIFTSMGLVSTSISKVIFNSLSLGNQIGGVLMGVVGFYLLGALTVDFRKPFPRTPVRYVTAFLFGVAVAMAYRPCVTPSLTEIYRIASNPSRINEGAVLLTAYSLGIATVITAAGIAISWALTKADSHRLENAAKRFCGVFLLIIAGLVLTDNMTTYKSFLVGRFVPESAPESRAK